MHIHKVLMIGFQAKLAKCLIPLRESSSFPAILLGSWKRRKTGRSGQKDIWLGGGTRIEARRGRDFFPAAYHHIKGERWRGGNLK
jgi:hypothetical protein